VAQREWGINKDTERLEPISDVKARFLATPESKRKEFEIRRTHTCQFCGVNYTAKSLDSDDQQAHFIPSKRDYKKKCQQHQNACQVKDSKKRPSSKNSPCSDDDYDNEAPIVNELILDGGTKVKHPRSSSTSTTRQPQSSSGKAHTLAKVAHTLISHQQSIAKYPLKVPGCGGETYETVFQYLSNIESDEYVKGTHIFYGCVNYKKLPTFKKGDPSDVFRLYLFKRKRPFTIQVFTDNWKPSQLSQFIESMNNARCFAEENIANGKKAYVYLFMLCTASPKYPNSLLANKFNHICIFGAHRILFNDKNLGLALPQLQSKNQLQKPDNIDLKRMDTGKTNKQIIETTDIEPPTVTKPVTQQKIDPVKVTTEKKHNTTTRPSDKSNKQSSKKKKAGVYSWIKRLFKPF
jgi:hypothetical protein